MRAISQNGRLRGLISMQNPPSPAPELKALLSRLQTKMSPAKSMQVRAEVLTNEIIARVQRESRHRK
jgi:hypothetical protein